MPTYELNINGKPHKVKAAANMPLLWVLRETVGLTGTKFGCGKGFCGACTVHADGEAIRACITPVSAIKDQAIVTIEGLSADHTHPLQLAWQKHQVTQCGYCQSGQIMAAAALLKKHGTVNTQLIEQEMNTVLCRCGTYQRIRQAILDAAQQADVTKQS
ncbi:MAG: 2Fe-2S iron-sulfur cluster binding domain-containing protein [Gammaproteobacteria bacterium]|nr:2Fe-2S iron-sulfur cluster binding domain-containing protein [Gammaproteobacteria bacterium]